MKKRFIALLAISLLLLGSMSASYAGSCNHTWRYLKSEYGGAAYLDHCHVTDGCAIMQVTTEYHYTCVSCDEVKITEKYSTIHDGACPY